MHVGLLYIFLHFKWSAENVSKDKVKDSILCLYVYKESKDRFLKSFHKSFEFSKKFFFFLNRMDIFTRHVAIP